MLPSDLAVLLVELDLARCQDRHGSDGVLEHATPIGVDEELQGARPPEQHHDLEMALEVPAAPVEVRREGGGLCVEARRFRFAALQQQLDLSYPRVRQLELGIEAPLLDLDAFSLDREAVEVRFEPVDPLPDRRELVVGGARRPRQDCAEGYDQDRRETRQPDLHRNSLYALTEETFKR